MPSLVRYSGRVARRAIPYQYRVAAKGIGMVYRNRKRIYRAASTIGRAYKRYKRKGSHRTAKRRRFGEPVGLSTTKKSTVVDNVDVTRQTRTLYSMNVTDIRKPAAGVAPDIDERSREIVNLRGFKYCMTFNNLTNKPLFVNLAVVVPKTPLITDIAPTVGFFRGTGNERALNFANSLNVNDFRCRPINSDRYIILMHKRVMLSGNVQTSGYTTGSGASYKVMDGYMKIGRQMRYPTGAGQTTSINQVELVYWMDGWNNTSGTAPANVAKVGQRVISYWKEPKN